MTGGVGEGKLMKETTLAAARTALAWLLVLWLCRESVGVNVSHRQTDVRLSQVKREEECGRQRPADFHNGFPRSESDLPSLDPKLNKASFVVVSRDAYVSDLLLFLRLCLSASWTKEPRSFLLLVDLLTAFCCSRLACRGLFSTCLPVNKWLGPPLSFCLLNVFLSLSLPPSVSLLLSHSLIFRIHSSLFRSCAFSGASLSPLAFSLACLLLRRRLASCACICCLCACYCCCYCCCL